MVKYWQTFTLPPGIVKQNHCIYVARWAIFYKHNFKLGLVLVLGWQPGRAFYDFLVLFVLNKVSIFWNNVSIVHTNSYRRDLWLNDFGVECRNIRNVTQIYRQTDSIWQLLNPICDHVVEFSCRILNFVYIKVSSTIQGRKLFAETR